jgi:tetratricopeptide (TPR) repeat protein
MTAASVVDDLTATALRQALSAAAAGRIAEACDIAERTLKDGGDAAALHALLGMLRFRVGDADASIRHLTEAFRRRPGDVVIANNLASSLAQQERYREALDVASDELAKADKSLQLFRVRGFVAQSLDELGIAAQAYEQVVAAVPGDWESWNNLGNVRRAANDAAGAILALRRAAEINPTSAPVRLNYATVLEFAGNFDDAERAYRQMAIDFPEDVNPMRELFAMLKTQFRDEAALEAIEEASRRAPDDVELALGVASHRLLLMRHGPAEDAYRQVLTIDRTNILAYLGIATAMDQTNRVDELAALVTEAASANLPPEGLSFVQAFDHRRAKRYAEGLEALSQVPDELETVRRQQLLGQLLEGAGQYDAAFAAFERMNAIAREDPSDPLKRAVAYRESVRQQSKSLTREWVDSWQPAPVDNRKSPTFLVGFPRSGTTLLDTILMGHPTVEVLEEEPTLIRATEILGGFEGLAVASGDQVAKARDAYFETTQGLRSLDPAKLLIDKNPFAMNSLPIICRLFPDAKIILALRHPCDVVLSCFVTNFKPNNAMVNFLSLDTAAELYDLSFDYFVRASDLLEPAIHTVVYENIVADRDRELRPLLQFLGLEWNERVLDHESTARNRGHIKTASYAQVIEPIYARSAGRWQNYREHLEPVFPVLEPWVRKFGYTL